MAPRRRACRPTAGRDLADGRELPGRGAAINVFARQNGLGLAVVDAGVAHDFAPVPG
jgi:hypothetical protein